MQKQKKKQETSRLEKFTTFLKESAALITAITALIAAIAGLLYFLLGKGSDRVVLFPTATPETDCPTYTRGLIQIGITANDGLQELYFVQSPASLVNPHLLVFYATNGELVGMTMFAYDQQKTQFILKSIVDRNCREVSQKDNIVQPISFANGDTATVKLSDSKLYKLKLLYIDNDVKGEFIDSQE